MAQHDYVIDNQTAPNFRADLNNALAAIVSTNSGSSAPSTTYANMLWYDTTNNILKMRNEADDTWINVGYLDQTTGAFRILDDTQVVNTSGTQTGLLGDQSTATWEGGTGTTESLVSPAKVKAAVTANSPFNASTEYNLGLLSAGTGTASHGLSAYPSLVFFTLECIEADLGYSIGDRLSFVQAEAANTNANGITGWYSTSQVGFAQDAPI